MIFSASSTRWLSENNTRVQMCVIRANLWLIGQTVQSWQLRQLREASVINAEMQVLVKDTEVLIAAFDNPASTLQSDSKNVSSTSDKTKKVHVRNDFIQLIFNTSITLNNAVVACLTTLFRWYMSTNEILPLVINYRSPQKLLAV